MLIQFCLPALKQYILLFFPEGAGPADDSLLVLGPGFPLLPALVLPLRLRIDEGFERATGLAPHGGKFARSDLGGQGWARPGRGPSPGPKRPGPVRGERGRDDSVMTPSPEFSAATEGNSM